MRRLAGLILVVFSVLALTGTAHAFLFDMGAGSSIDASATSSALLMYANINPELDTITYNLAPGDSRLFYFATIGTLEGSIESDDLVSKPIIAHFDFDNPDIAQAVGGNVVGTIGGFFGSTQGWNLTWTDPVTVNFGNGGQFTIELTDASYSSDWWQGPGGQRQINATVKLISEPSVTSPEPATMSLLGLGLLGLFGFKKRIS